MIIAEIFKIVMIFGILIGIGFIVYTNFSPRRKDKSIIYLNFFVLFFTLNNLQITLADYDYITINFFQRKLLLPFYVLIIPSFYTFITYYLKVEKKIQSFVLISSIIFLIEIIIRIVLCLYFYDEKSYYIVAKYAQIEEIVNVCYILFLYFKVVIIFQYQYKVYENITSFDNMNWIKKFLLFGFIILVLWVFAIVFNIKEVLSPNIPVYYPLRLSSTLIIIWIAYYGFFKYNLLLERIELRKEIIKSIINKDVNLITDASFSKIEKYIINDKKYLDPLLSVDSIAKALNISNRNISNITNSNSSMNILDFINFYRIEEAKIILTHPDYSNYTITSIGFECGFNSKATFYRAFSKFTGTSPAEFRLKYS